MPRSTQSRKLVIFLQYVKSKLLQLLLCSIVMQSIQIVYKGRVMFVVTCFWMIVVKNGCSLLDHRTRKCAIYRKNELMKLAEILHADTNLES